MIYNLQDIATSADKKDMKNTVQKDASNSTPSW